MSSVGKDFFSGMEGKKIIAYGTGYAGKLVVPVLSKIPDINLLGVTNSRILQEDYGTYLDTGIPIRSLQEWKKRVPDAIILVTAFRGYDEICENCHTAGFRTILFPSAELLEFCMKWSEDIAGAKAIGDLESFCFANEIRDTHSASFSEFKGCHRNQTVVVVGCGPTLNYYEPIDGAIHIGTNSSILREDLKLDYYFLLHYIPKWCEKIQSHNCINFFGVNRNENSDDQFPEYVIEENHARRFFYNRLLGKAMHSMEHYPLMGYLSVIFPAIQFALYTRPKKILLVGCDCSPNGHFDGSPQLTSGGDSHIPIWIMGYQRLKAMAARHYPDTEILSVNPVGLTALFQDVYTQRFLEAHMSAMGEGVKNNDWKIL